MKRLWDLIAQSIPLGVCEDYGQHIDGPYSVLEIALENRTWDIGYGSDLEPLHIAKIEAEIKRLGKTR